MDNLLLLVFASICQISMPVQTTLEQAYQAQHKCVANMIICYNAYPEKDQIEDSEIVKECLNGGK